MNPETFFDKFGLLADTPNGVQKLRELILQLAVQGKLVAQNPNDEPAAVLLEKIKVEKERLVKERVIKKTKPLPSIESKELPFLIPKEWKWVRFGNLLLRISNGYSGKQNKTQKGIPISRIETIAYGFIDRSRVGYAQDVPEDVINKYILHSRDILFSHINSAKHLGKTAIYPNDELMIHGINLLLIRLFNEYILSDFIHLTLMNLRNSGFFISIAQHAINQASVNQTKLKNIIIPLPPLAEQRRIVARVDQLMALCDELEARQQKKQETRLRLNSAALDKLLTVHEPTEFANHWQRVCDNFDLLYDNPKTVGELRKAILQLAVQGKLVRQDENDEPAAVLLGRIREKKEELVKDGKIKKTKAPFLWEEGEVPYKLPKEWKWTRFCNIATIASNLVKPEFYLDLPHVAPNNIEKQTGKLYQYRTIREDNVRSGNHRFYSGQILYSKIRPNLAKVTIVNFEGLCSADMYPINAYIDSKFLLKYMLSQTFLSMSVKKDTRVAMPKINQNELNKILVPVPPISEQRRIVAKVDQFMALCDELKSKLNQSQTDGAKLMEAVVAEIVSNR